MYAGVAAVTAPRSEQIWATEKRGDWSRSLLKAALRTLDAPIGKLSICQSKRGGQIVLQAVLTNAPFDHARQRGPLGSVDPEREEPGPFEMKPQSHRLAL